MAVEVEGAWETGPARGRGRRMLRWVLRLLTVVVFVAAAAVLVSLIRDSGVFGGRPSERALFTDVPVTHPYRGPIEELSRRKILPGISDSLFAPDIPVSRALMATAVVRAMSWEVAPGEKQPYQDVSGVSSRKDAADYIAVASRQGVLGRVSTEGPPLFKPDQAIGLGQALVALTRTGEGSLTVPAKLAPEIAKLETSDEIKSALSIAQANKLLADTKIDPLKADLSKPLTRGQLAVIVSNFLKVVPPASTG